MFRKFLLKSAKRNRLSSGISNAIWSWWSLIASVMTRENITSTEFSLIYGPNYRSTKLCSPGPRCTVSKRISWKTINSAPLSFFVRIPILAYLFWCRLLHEKNSDKAEVTAGAGARAAVRSLLQGHRPVIISGRVFIFSFRRVAVSDADADVDAGVGDDAKGVIRICPKF